MAFREGDKVVCREATGAARLKEGEVYTVRVCDSGYVGLREFKELSPEWDERRFEKVEEV